MTRTQHPDGSRTYHLRDLDTGEEVEVRRAAGEPLWPVLFRALHYPGTTPGRRASGAVAPCEACGGAGIVRGRS